MQLSYWEIKNWFSNVDFTIVGSGIVGLHTALALRERFPSSKILILEKGVLPQGASTKNAGFACFGSISEIIDDLKTHTEEEVIQLLTKLADALGDVAYCNAFGFRRGRCVSGRSCFSTPRSRSEKRAASRST